MKQPSRRDFLRRGSFGLAAMGLGSLTLRADAAPTAGSGELPEDLVGLLDLGSLDLESLDLGSLDLGSLDLAPLPQDKKLRPTKDNIQGPFYRAGAPFRAKVTPPMEPGEIVLIRGRVWGHDSRKPLAGAVLDIWQANAKGRYDNDDPKKQPRKGVYINRARVISDEQGDYEFETIFPGRYKNGDTYRPAHIHYMVRARGYRRLVTQLYFKGDPFNDSDPFIQDSLIIDLDRSGEGDRRFRRGTFDVVLVRSR